MINREEVAEKLREAARTFDKEYPNGAKDWLDENAAFTTVDKIIGTDDSVPYAAFFNRLADLIDPTCRIYYTDTTINTPDTGYEPDGYYSCSCCGELDDCFAEMWDDYQAKDYEGEPPFRYCPHCGARVVRDED